MQIATTRPRLSVEDTACELATIQREFEGLGVWPTHESTGEWRALSIFLLSPERRRFSEVELQQICQQMDVLRRQMPVAVIPIDDPDALQNLAERLGAVREAFLRIGVVYDGIVDFERCGPLGRRSALQPNWNFATREDFRRRYRALDDSIEKIGRIPTRQDPLPPPERWSSLRPEARLAALQRVVEGARARMLLNVGRYWSLRERRNPPLLEGDQRRHDSLRSRDVQPVSPKWMPWRSYRLARRYPESILSYCDARLLNESVYLVFDDGRQPRFPLAPEGYSRSLGPEEDGRPRPKRTAFSLAHRDISPNSVERAVVEQLGESVADLGLVLISRPKFLALERRLHGQS